ncbi:hypothetical protein FB451DRAFT_1223890 [Mycena latifolia]|nr:hypothetical protein FB451DRAFT_1223890 [Mycena latifolia]
MPNGFLITIIVSGLAMTIYVLRLALPSRMIRSLEKSLYDVERFFYYTFETPGFNRGISGPKTDIDLAERLVVLQNKADQLRMQTLFHGTFLVQWGDLWGLFMGHSFAIWRCNRKVQCLGNEMQMRQQKRLLEINTELAIGTSPALQLTMRQRCGTLNYIGGPCVGPRSC